MFYIKNIAYLSCMKTNNKKYLLIWLNGKSINHIAEGTIALMKYKEAQLKKSGTYNTGKLIVISEDGLKYKLKPSLTTHI